MTYGTVKYSPVKARASVGHGEWLIECEPFVRTRMKRVFPKAPQVAGNVLYLSDTPENARELEWFLIRYPMLMDPHVEDRLRSRASYQMSIEQKVAALLEGREPIPPIELALPPREYQVYGAAMLNTRNGLLLADEVGVGKTVTGICSIVHPDNLPALVVTPTNLPTQWVEQLNRFAPDLLVHQIKKGSVYSLFPRKRAGGLFPDRLPDVIVTNYFKLRGWADHLAGQVKLVIFDECQQLRNNESDIYRACEHVASHAQRRLGMSATPIYNYGGEFFWVLQCLMSDVLGSREEFLREWCGGYEAGKLKLADPEAFGAFLRREGIMLRRTRKDVGRELPGLQKIPHLVNCDSNELARVAGNAIALARIIMQPTEEHRGDKMNASGQFDAIMRQATGVAKAPYVAEFVRLLLESGEKVLLFGWHREVYSIWLEMLKDFNPRLYTGSETPAVKEASKKAFEKGETNLLIMSLRAGAGADGLQFVCRTAVFGELDWSPGVHEQCYGRLYRDGQPDPVAAYFLHSDEGTDPVMVDALRIKRDQIEGVNNPGSTGIVEMEKGSDNIREVARRMLEAKGILEPAILAGMS